MEKAEDHKGLKFIDHVDQTIEAVEKLTDRAYKVADFHEGKGRATARRTSRRLKILSEAWHDATSRLDELLIDPSDELKALAQKLEEN